MFFNSISFALFLPLVFLLYWFLFKNSVIKQNILLLIASYYFYSCWDWRFLFLLVFSTGLDFFSGLLIFKENSILKKKVLLFTSVFINLGFLAVFKYYNFFAESFADFASQIGFKVSLSTLSVILPVGISFYTFHGLSYVFDIFNGKIKPTNNFINYSLFVSFFPLLVAGPIERATHLLPQVENPRNFNYIKAVDGCKQILWGIFKKVVIADNCAFYANMIFDNHQDYSGATLLIGAVFFAVQIYGDFSGYSDIALGTARLLGFELLKNFSFPYFSRSIAEFWRRWHISLSSWFKDYLYIPLGGSQGSLLKKIRNVFIIFLVSGFWHGANWTFIVWGAINALFFLPSLLMKTNRVHKNIIAQGRNLPTAKEFFNMSLTFFCAVFAWIFFRSPSLSVAYEICKSMLLGLFSIRNLRSSLVFLRWEVGIALPVLLLFFIIVEWLGREGNYALEAGSNPTKYPTFLRVGFYYILIILIFIFSGKEQQFIYFQF